MSRQPLHRPGVHEGIDLELENHLAERTDRLIEEGWDPSEARAEAERRFGSLAEHRAELLTEAGTDGPAWRILWGADAVFQDIRYALRGVRRNPGFAMTLIATLALGIGATGGVFSVIDAVLLRPLPYAEPDRLVMAQPNLERQGIVLSEFQTEQVAPWIERADFLADVALHSRVGMLRTDADDATEIGANAVSDNLDEVLGIEAAMGRMLEADDVAEGRQVAVLSWSYWSRMGANPDVVGTTMELNDGTWTVVGVLPRGMKFPVAGTSDLWIPRSNDGTVLGVRRSQTGVVGRLVDGLEPSVAQERADALGQQMDEADPTEIGWQVALNSVEEWRANGDTEQGLWLVGGAVALMLVIALVNSVNLLLVRGQSRLAEIGVRRALGASRLRIVRQVVIESLLLSLGAGLAATLVAWAGVEAIRIIAPAEVTFGMVHDFGLEARALSVVFAVATLSGLAVGSLPGLKLATTRVAGSGAAGAGARDRSGARLRSGLVIGEVAVSVVLLVGAGLFVRSFAEMYRVDLGMETEELALLTLDLPRIRYADGPARAAFVQSMLSRLEGLPGATSVSVGRGAPPEGGGFSFASALQAEGGEAVEGEAIVPFVAAGPGYFETLGTTLIAGRGPEPGDGDTDGVVIDRDLATTLFGEASPVGRRFTLDATDDEVEWHTVVGVVEELALGGPDDRLGSGAIIYPLDLSTPGSYLVFMIRTGGQSEALLGPARAALRAEDSRLPVISLQTGRQAMSEALDRPRFLVWLMSILAGLALLLAGVGIYGVVSFTVRQRRREMGIRLALGAAAKQVQTTIVVWGLLLATIGTALGIAAALVLDNFVAALLFGISPGDTATLASVATVMIGVTWLACLIPARRASRVDPVEILKSD